MLYEVITEEIKQNTPWATLGKEKSREPNIITSLELRSEEMEKINLRLQGRYRSIEENEVRYEEIMCEDAEYLIVAFGTSARVCQKAVEIVRAEGIRNNFV